MKHQFWTFYDFTDNNGFPPFQPLVQYQLKKRIEKLTNLYPEWNESDYVQYFGEIFLNKPEGDAEKRFAHWHFLAYLDLDRCYLIWRNFHGHLEKFKLHSWSQFLKQFFGKVEWNVNS